MWKGDTCVAPILTFFKTKIFDSIGSVLHEYEFTKSSFVQRDLLALYQKKPSERFELSTPGLQDQCSNPWATKAMHLVGKTKWRYSLAICVCLLLIRTIRLSFAFSNSCIFLKLCVNASSPFSFYLMKSDSHCRDQDSNLGYCGHNAMY